MRSLLLIVLAACATEAPPRQTVFFPPRQLDLDITVGHSGVAVYTSSTDRDCPGNFAFPQVGESAVWGDLGCGGSCLTRLAVETAAATTEDTVFSWEPATIAVDVTGQPDAVLVIEGCGGSARILVGGLAVPTASASAAFDATRSSIEVSWSGEGGRSALLWFNAALWSELRHTAAHDYRFVATFNTEAITSVGVEVFRSMSPVGTDYGIARVWSVESTFAMVDTRPSASEAAENLHRAR